MLKTLISLIITVLIAINPLYSNNELYNKEIDTDIKKKRICDIVFGISYGSAMVGSGIGIVSGLFWAFDPKNKTVSMAFCLTGCSLFLLGLISGLISTNVFCKESKYSTEDISQEKITFILTLNILKSDYAFGLTYKF